MAEHVHITPTLTPHVNGVAASVADLVPSSPDAELLRLCAEYEALVQALLATDFKAMPGTPAAERAEAEQGSIYAAMADLLDQLNRMDVQTLEGAVAVARLLAANDEELFQKGEPGGYHQARLTAVLVGGLIGWPA